jgi:hypothetical protein
MGIYGFKQHLRMIRLISWQCFRHVLIKLNLGIFCLGVFSLQFFQNIVIKLNACRDVVLKLRLLNNSNFIFWLFKIGWNNSNIE